MPHSTLHTIFGLLELAKLACRSRFRMRGAYWRWREETAFGYGGGCDAEGEPVSRQAKWRAILEYGRWVYQMKRLR